MTDEIRGKQMSHKSMLEVISFYKGRDDVTDESCTIDHLTYRSGILTFNAVYLEALEIMCDAGYFPLDNHNEKRARLTLTDERIKVLNRSLDNYFHGQGGHFHIKEGTYHSNNDDTEGLINCMDSDDPKVLLAVARFFKDIELGMRYEARQINPISFDCYNDKEDIDFLIGLAARTVAKHVIPFKRSEEPQNQAKEVLLYVVEDSKKMMSFYSEDEFSQDFPYNDKSEFTEILQDASQFIENLYR